LAYCKFSTKTTEKRNISRASRTDTKKADIPDGISAFLELLGRFELPTSSLPTACGVKKYTILCDFQYFYVQNDMLFDAHKSTVSMR